MTSTSTTTNADGTTNSAEAIKNALLAAYDEAGLDPDAPLGDLPSEALVDALGGVLLHRDHATAAANGDPLPVTEEERREAFGTGVQATPGPDRPFEDDADLDASIVDDADEDLEAFGTGVSGDTSREDRERRDAQVEVLADALERLANRRDEGTDDD